MGYRIEYIDGIKFTHPSVLYKYRCWNNHLHKKILTENKIYLASPKNFEDIYDCNVPEKFPSKDELYKFFLYKAKNDYPQWTRQEKRKFARKWTKKSPLAKPKVLADLIEKFNNEFNNRFGVLSMTADPNNDAMWGKYGDNHQGVCIGFDTHLLFNCVGGGGEVHYVEKLPEIDFLKDDFKSKHVKNIFFKEEKWSFEKEYRLHKMWQHNVDNEERNIELPADCIVKIILGKKMPSLAKEEISQIAKIKYPHAEIVEDK